MPTSAIDDDSMCKCVLDYFHIMIGCILAAAVCLSVNVRILCQPSMTSSNGILLGMLLGTLVSVRSHQHLSTLLLRHCVTAAQATWCQAPTPARHWTCSQGLFLGGL
jgi:xanthine/uracil permease